MKSTIANSSLHGIHLFMAILLTPVLFVSCMPKRKPYEIKINEIQVLGSHNSYKQEIQPELLEFISKYDSNTAKELDYYHIKLTDQLNLGLRSLELDVVYDPEGGKFSKPYGNEILKNSGITPWPYDTLNEMQQAGFKVLHVPDLDFRSSCATLKKALQELKAWSDKHPWHIPVIITMNTKTQGIVQPGFEQLLSFTHEAFDSLDKEILSVFPKDQLITPDDIRGKYNTLNKAVLQKKWPLLKNSRKKFVFVLDETGEKLDTYAKDHPSLRNRVMFVNAKPGTEYGAIVILNDPVNYQDSIQHLVKKGYIVRTRADADTWEARNNNHTRFYRAMSSGAQVISTDFYMKNNWLKTDYHVIFPQNTTMRFNPVLCPNKSTSIITE